MNTFRVKNYEKFQHYKDRAPPWIKLYNELLDDYEFGSLPDASKMHLIAIWLLASRSENKIPYDAGWVGKRINATEHVDLALLAERGFILLDQPLQGVEHSAIKPLAECLSRERGRDRGETEGGGGTREREPLISDEAFEIATMVGEIAGLPDPKEWPPAWCGSPMRVMELLSHGWTRADFDAGARAAMSRRTEPPYSFKFFEGPISRAFANRTAPVPVGKPETPHAPTRQRSALTSVLDEAIARAEEAERRDAEGGKDSVRLLSHG